MDPLHVGMPGELDCRTLRHGPADVQHVGLQHAPGLQHIRVVSNLRRQLDCLFREQQTQPVLAKAVECLLQAPYNRGRQIQARLVQHQRRRGSLISARPVAWGWSCRTANPCR